MPIDSLSVSFLFLVAISNLSRVCRCGMTGQSGERATMGIRPIFLAAIGALAIGAFAIGLISGAAWIAIGKDRDRELQLAAFSQRSTASRLPSAKLGERLMARIGQHFVADTSDHWDKGLSMTFYGQPKPFGDWLCRVVVFRVPDKIVRGVEEPRYEDDLDLSTRYAIWRRPTAAPPTAKEGDVACAAYRDFEHMFDSPVAGPQQRGPYVADVIFEQVSSGHVTIPLTCQDHHAYPLTSACDAVKILRGLTLKELGGVSTKSEKQGDGVITYEDLLTFELKHSTQCCSEELLNMTVTSDQHVGRQGGDKADPRSAALEIECIC